MRDESLSNRMHIDIPLLFGLIILCGIGLVVLYSAAAQDYQMVAKQAIRLLIAFTLMFFVAQISPTRLSRLSFWIYIIGVFLLIFVLLYGYTGRGAQRWIDLSIFRFQPSELMKLAVPMILAWYFSSQSLPPSLVRIFFAVVMIMVPVVLIAYQPDLGTSLLVAVAGVAVLFIAGMSWRLIGSMVLLLAMFTPVLWYMMHDYQRQRVFTFLNPGNDPLGSGYHIIQSQIAIGSGGLYGKGWLNGTQSHLEFLPERSTDFVFAVFAEEFGLMGVLLLIAIYMFIIIRGLYISANAQDSYGRMLGCGLTLTFFIYIFVNMGMVSGQLPVVGVPLPLISYGGTSMATLMIGFGILMSIHTHRRFLSE